MKLKPILLIIAVGLAGAGAWHFSADTKSASSPSQSVSTLVATAPAAMPVGMPAADEGAATPKDIAGLIADASGGDAGKRAAAITALAKAPRAEAVPVLSRVLTDGEPAKDRPLALRSLRELALEQGDADGAIREAIRAVIYHGDDQNDQTMLADVQDTLDVIEESEMR